jgi:hypothetical protein
MYNKRPEKENVTRFYFRNWYIVTIYIQNEIYIQMDLCVLCCYNYNLENCMSG